MRRFFPILACLGLLALGACVTRPPLLDAKASQEAEALGQYLSGRYALLNQDPAEAADRFGAALDTAPAEAHLGDRAVQAALLANDFPVAVRLAERTRARNGASALTNLTLGTDALRRRSPSARTYFEAAGVSASGRAVVFPLIAWSVFDTQGVDAAAGYIKSAMTEKDMDAAAARRLLGLIYLAGNRDEQAMETFKALASDRLLSAEATGAYAKLLAASARRDEALALLDAPRTNEEAAVALAVLRNTLAKGETAEIARLNGRQGAARAFVEQAEAARIRQMPERANFHLAFALALDPGFAPARLMLSEAMEGTGRAESALAELDQIAKTSMFFAEAETRRAWILHRLKRADAARAAAQTARASAPPRAVSIELADLYRAMGDHAAAESLLTPLIDADPKSADVWRLLYARGSSRERQGNWPGARSDLEAAYALEPSNPSLLNYLGYAYVEHGEKLEHAFTMLEKAARLQPNSGAIADSLGWAHFKLGRYEEARAKLERAVQLAPANPVLHDHLGDAYAKTGRTLEARYAWQRALKLAPEADLKAALQTKLAGTPVS